MRRNLTAKLIENLKPATDRRYEVRDALLPGFGIRVSVSGGKSWFVVARVDGRQVRHTLGTYPIVTLSEAREAARPVLKDIQLGVYAPSKPPPKPDLPTKSQIARPRVYERLEPNRPYTIFGAAWAGDTDVTEIWISLDGSASWVQGDFLDPINRHAWRRWKYDWITPAQPGRCTLLARAVGADQRGQQDAHDPNFGSYVIDHTLPIEVFVAAV
jgi:hypothetical protein